MASLRKVMVWNNNCGARERVLKKKYFNSGKYVKMACHWKSQQRRQKIKVEDWLMDRCPWGGRGRRSGCGVAGHGQVEGWHFYWHRTEYRWKRRDVPAWVLCRRQRKAILAISLILCWWGKVALLNLRGKVMTIEVEHTLGMLWFPSSFFINSFFILKQPHTYRKVASIVQRPFFSESSE